MMIAAALDWTEVALYTLGGGVIGGVYAFVNKAVHKKHKEGSSSSATGSGTNLPTTMQNRLGKTRSTFATTLTRLRGKSTVDPSFWTGVEEMLLLSDVGITTTEFICEKAQSLCDENKTSSTDEALVIVKEVLLGVFQADREPIIKSGLNVWLFVGVNGVGKTTSIAKIANFYRRQDRSVLMVAGDTFRAAAADQLETWATRTGADIVRSTEGADPASVVFDGMEKANAKQYEVVLVDTAGRLHTKSNLMEEVKKIRRVVERTQDALKEVLIVIDASTGQNGLVQAREFGEAMGITGVVLSKLDGSSKGGIVLAIEHELGVPIKWVGLGEGQNDLVPFNPKEYVDALVS
ncbi:MAG TPA: signal recognition particle-docking protein FtsY [Acidimicrobiia bacterium]|nr:signal recognition particle-docking protein FtsY [Acidimicrobiia bacterium]